MKLTYFTVSNFRSITNAYKLKLKDVTVLIGKNNEGKSNLINALNLAMEIIHYVGYYQRKMVPPRSYNWSNDFPLQLQNNKKIRNKTTDFRLDFSLDAEEIQLFKDEVGSTINGELSVYISIKQDGSLSFTIPKQGKNATALTKKYASIASFIFDSIDLQYIPAIRAESDAYGVINEIVESELSATNDPKYIEAKEYIEQYQRQKLKELSERIKTPLSRFMPKIKSVDILIEDKIRRKSILQGKSVVVEMDDGVKTRLSQKGDGVKSLTTMAILSQTKATDRIIIVDEPENHLHPEAIRYLRQVLYTLAENNQIIISTHNPIFVNRCNVQSNIIVDKNEAKAASRVDEIRNLLGVMVSDNLVYSDYVIVVEGLTDKILIERVLRQDKTLSRMLDSNVITVRVLAGVNNLMSELYSAERYLCHYIVLLDNDTAAIEKAKEVKRRLSVSSDRFRYFVADGMRESELEDLYDPSVYKDYLKKEYQIDITKGLFKNTTKKWSRRIEELAVLAGRKLDKEDLDAIKQKTSELVLTDGIHLTSDGQELINNIVEIIKQETHGIK